MNGQKIFFIAFAVIVIGVGGYLFATGQVGGKSDSSSGISALTSSTSGINPANSSPIDEQSGAEIANLLNNVSQIDLDGAIFTDPAFLSLIDSSVILPPVVTDGRVNPFAR